MIHTQLDERGGSRAAYHSLAIIMMIALPTLGAGSCEPEEESWCAAAAGGAPGDGSVLALSAAHASVRYFGDAARLSDADEALVRALAGADADLGAYADALSGVCAAPSHPGGLPAASVTLEGSLAYVKPGTGTLRLPLGAEGVVLDLRGLPDAEGLREALDAAASLALAEPVSRPRRAQRSHYGLTDAVFSRTGVYRNSVEKATQAPIPAGSARALPLGILTGGPLPPEAALVAGTLRLKQRAWLFGEAVWAATAEARWSPVGDEGLVWRSSELYDGARRWADRILPDIETDIPEVEAGQLLALGEVPAAQVSGDERPSLSPFVAYGDIQSAGQSLAEMRAALITVHGTLKRFFPYFDAIGGDRTDQRLAETLTSAGDLARDGALGRVDMLNLLRRFGEAISDGHQFVWDSSGYSEVVGYLPVGLDRVGEDAVIWASADPALRPGDTLLTIDGITADQWYEREYARTSAASEGYRFDLASRYLVGLEAPMELSVRGVDGQVRRAQVEPASSEVYLETVIPPFRRLEGYLTDLGAPDLYYLNLEGEILLTDEQLFAALEEAEGAAGMVVDMRGYPGSPAYEALDRLQLGPYHAPIFRVPTWTGPEERDLDEAASIYPNAEDPHYHGPLALLVGPVSVSSAENIATCLVNEDRVTVVGRQSASTNGNITGVQLAGAFSFTFTGMEVLYADGSTFHGVGIVPDILAEPTAAHFAQGRDAELEAAIEALR